jgi:hypothetical protein
MLERDGAVGDERVRFGFEDTGAARSQNNRVDARFSWSVE